MDFFAEYFSVVCDVIRASDTTFITRAADMIRNCHARGNKIIVAGNGGSAAIASHVAVDLTKIAGIRAITFNEADLITCFANDFGYENWVAHALRFYADKGDIAILLSSSGCSPNMIRAAETAKQIGLEVITLTGFDAGNPLRNTGGDLNLWIDNRLYNIVESVHQLWLLSVIDLIAGNYPEGHE